MTIYLYTGTPGSGKSYHMAQQIYWSVRRGVPVVCNFEVNHDMWNESSSFTYLDDDDLTPRRLYEISRDYFKGKRAREGALKLFIDECAVYFNARTWNDQARKDWVKFFSQHRKLGYDVYLITQFDTMVDKQLRALVEYEVKHRKFNNVGWVGKLASLVCLGHPLFVRVHYWYPMKERTGCEWGIGLGKYYRMYDTFAVFSGNEVTTDAPQSEAKGGGLGVVHAFDS